MARQAAEINAFAVDGVAAAVRAIQQQFPKAV
jgi:hypothetical protein